MAVATLHADLGSSATWQRFQQACLGVVLALAVGCILYAVETLLFHSPHRFVENPADTMTRAVGLAHFSTGWLFLFTSPRLRTRRALASLSGWSLLGMGCCAGFAWAGADKNPFMLLAFYSFFFIHEVRDEARLYQRSGELPPSVGDTEGFLSALGISTTLTLVTLLAGLQLWRGHWLGRSPLLSELPTFWLLAGWSMLALCAGIAVVVTLHRARRLHGSVQETLLVYQPLLAVYTGISTILLVGSLFGSIGANLVILVHGMTWLVYTHQSLSERNQQTTGWWAWLRQTPAGFLTLHLGASALFLLLFALRTHVWQRTGLLCDALARTSFPYWSIMHIAMAFWRAK